MNNTINDWIIDIKPLCKKCKKEVDFCAGYPDHYNETYFYEIRCHGNSEIIQGNIMDIFYLDEYKFEG